MKRHISNADIVLYDENTWKRYQIALKKGSLCRERNLMARWRTKIYFQKADTEFKFDYKISKPPENVKTHYFYIVMMDCSLEEYDAHPAPMYYHLELYNGGSHLPADEDGMITLHAFAAIFTMLGFVGFMTLALQFHAKKGQIHLVTVFLGLSWILQVSLILILYHSRFYRDFIYF